MGTVYYRLTQYDYDGKFEELGIRSLFSEERKIRKIINLMGQEVDLEYDGIKIILYDNGECIKRY